MRLPARLITGHLVWTHDAAAWAVWRVPATSYPFLPAAQKLQWHARVRGLLMALPAEAQLLSVCRRVAPRELAAAVQQAVPDRWRASWREHTRADLARLTRSEVVERRFYLACRLLAPGSSGSLAAALGPLAAAFGVPSAPPPERHAARARRLAAELEARLTGQLRLERVSPAELGWLYRRAPRRGLADPPPPADTAPTTRAGTLVDDVVLLEGGDADDPGRPRHRRYLAVDVDGCRGYQTTAVIADMPAAFDFPGGGEWFLHVDDLPFAVDWCVRVTTVPNADAQAQARKQARQLTAQLEEYEGEPAGPPGTLAGALEGVDDEQAALSANPAEPELQATLALTIAAPDLAELETRAARLAAAHEPLGYTLQRPTGGQLALFTAGLPAAPRPAVCGDYVQHLLPRDLAAGAPFAVGEVGDPRGMLLGVSLDRATTAPVLFDPAFGPATNRSGSLGAFGALGSGKSYVIKRIALATLARGGQVVVLDRTVAGEYRRLAPVAPCRSAVVTLGDDADTCLDPLQVFTGADRVAIAQGFLAVLTRTAPTDGDGALLARVVREVADADAGRLVDVVAGLERLAARDRDARALHRKLTAIADHPLARLVFGAGAPLSLDADYVCFHAPGLSLPDREVLLTPHLARQLLPEQVFSQALLYLVAAVARALTFADPHRFGAALFDEAWALTASPQGRQLLLDGIRDGRKHNAAVWVLSQHPGDLGDDALSHLLGNRMLFRQPRGAAAAALAFAGLDADEDLAQLLETGLGEGQCLFRDVRDRIGLVGILDAGDPAVAAALDTTPGPVDG